ncbi:MAG: hypothetical protein GY807_05615 [Gammaproteobacteria bacterium]|nr:hypothetical protein [Gammaproteobacteria bacterium]
MTHYFDNLSAYSIGEELTRDAQHTVCRATRLRDRKPVLLKTRISQDPSEPEPGLLKREYNLTNKLSGDAVLRPLGLKQINERTVLILEDPGGQFLSSRLGTGGTTTLSFLESAIPMAEALNRVHQYGIVHRNIKPGSIYVDPLSRKSRLTGFEVATRLPRASQAMAYAGLIDESLVSFRQPCVPNEDAVHMM